jgi:hypothetical protein
VDCTARQLLEFQQPVVLFAEGLQKGYAAMRAGTLINRLFGISAEGQHGSQDADDRSAGYPRGRFSNWRSGPSFQHQWCRQWCREVPTMVPYGSPRSVSVGIGLHRNGGRTPDYVSKDRRRKPLGRWSLRRQFASDCFDLHRIASKVRETGVEPARVSPLDPKSSASANSATLAN